MKKILLFGGTFDPIHLGHLGLLDIVKQRLGIDEVYLIPTKQPPWKTEMAPISARLEMMQLALFDYDFHISTYEVEQAGVNYTIDTILHFKDKYPNDVIYYLIGADQAELFHEWKEATRISQLVKLVVYGRPGYGLARSNIDAFHMLVVEGRKFDTSSTQIRSLSTLDIPFTVIEYIIDHNLYFTRKLKSYYDDKRFLHIVSVAKLAYQIAKNNKLDAGKAALAALLHDIAKDMDPKQAKELVISEFPTLKDIPSFSIHQYAGAILAKRDFNVQDEEVLEAIRYHATAKPHMLPLSKVLYAADKIEPTRGFDSKALIQACLDDYHLGFIAVLRANYEYHRENDKPFKYYITAEAMKYYLEDIKFEKD